jgi:hypothetical protein
MAGLTGITDWLDQWGNLLFSGVLVVATIASAWAAVLLTKLTKRQTNRDDAHVHVRVVFSTHPPLIPTDAREMKLEIWNSGLRDTQLRAIYLEWPRPVGPPGRLNVYASDWEWDDANNVPREIPRDIRTPVLKSGQLWRFTAQVHRNDDLADEKILQDPHRTVLCVQPVLGQPRRLLLNSEEQQQLARIQD